MREGSNDYIQDYRWIGHPGLTGPGCTMYMDVAMMPSLCLRFTSSIVVPVVKQRGGEVNQKKESIQQPHYGFICGRILAWEEIME